MIRCCCYLSYNYFLGYVAIINEKIVGASIGYMKPWIEGIEYYVDQFFIDYASQIRALEPSLFKK